MLNGSCLMDYKKIVTEIKLFPHESPHGSGSNPGLWNSLAQKIVVGVRNDRILKVTALKFKLGVFFGVGSNLQLSRGGINFVQGSATHGKIAVIVEHSWALIIDPRSRSYQPKAFRPSGPGRLFFLGWVPKTLFVMFLFCSASISSYEEASSKISKTAKQLDG